MPRLLTLLTWPNKWRNCSSRLAPRDQLVAWMASAAANGDRVEVVFSCELTRLLVMQSTCQAILALMSDSAPDSPLNCDAGNLLRNGDTRGYNSLARMYTIEYAMGQQ